MSITVEVSWGELLDKVTILQIKSERMANPAKLANVQKELTALETRYEEAMAHSSQIRELFKELKSINETLWEIEDDIRDCERQKAFGDRFIQLARSVYFTNDQRAVLKRKLNEALGSALVEEKSYQAYA